MSAPVTRSSTNQIDHSRPVDAVNSGGKSTGSFRVDSGPAQPASDTPRGPDLFALVIAEATDGDSTEAEMRASLGLARRDGVREDGEENLRSDDSRTERARKVPKQPETGDREQGQGNAADPVLNSLQRRNLAAKPAAAAEVAAPAPRSPLVESHNQLMVLTSKMPRAQVATHLSQGHSENLVRIHAQPHWSIERTALEDLNAAQMAVGR
jgi:hypothetical protein